MDPLRIFISSPGDVEEERRRTAIVIQRIRREFSRFFDVSAILWEYDPMLSSGHFQDVIEKPSNTDIVVLILWSRLGTPLPADRYRGIDGRTPVTGTEWEFEDALAAKRERGSPDLLVYRKLSPPQAAFADPEQLARAQQQWALLQDFWLRHFVGQDGVFKAAFNHFNALDEYEHLLETHLRTLLRERVARRLRADDKRPVAWHAGSPFRGLSVFGPEHAAIFFGREKAEQQLVEQLARRAGDGTAFVAVLGASGSGKSSLLRAGVLPTLESPGVVAGVARWRRMIFAPSDLGGDPFQGLAGRLLGPHALPEAKAIGNAAAWHDKLLNTPEQAVADIGATLAGAAKAASLSGGAMPMRLFILVDQLEEIFTSPGFTPAIRETFIGLLGVLARSGAVWVAATMRSDFFSRVQEVEALAVLLAGEGSHTLAAPRGPEIERMIKLPADAAGIAFEVDPASGIGLDSELLEAAMQSPGALPLLEFTLDELYRRDIEAGGGEFLSFASFHALGGLEGAIAARAEATLASLPISVVAALPELVRSLVTVGDDDRIGARTAPEAELQKTPDAAALTDALIAARLLVVSSADGAAPIHVATVRVAHEALLRAWPRAMALIAEDMDLLRARARAEQAMSRWLAEREAPDFLLPRGRPLAEAAELLAARRGELGADLVRFIESSIAADEARRTAELAAERARADAEAEAARERAERALEQAAAARRLARRTRVAAMVLGVLLLIAVGAGIYASLQRAQALRQRNAALESQSHFLADAASAAMESGDARLARLLALAALPADLQHPDRPYVAAAEAALAQSWGDDRLIEIRAKPAAPGQPAAKAAATPGRYAQFSALLRSVLPRLATLSFAFSAQGDRTVIAGEGHARVYDLDNHVLLDVPHTADKGAIALDAKGAQLAQGEGAGARLWAVDTHASRLLAGVPDDAVLKLAFSPSASRLIAAGEKGGVSIWSLPDGKSFTALTGVAGPVADLIISPDGTRAVVTGADGRAALYDLDQGRAIAMLGDAAQMIGDADARALRQGVGFLAKFSDDGALVATATDATHVRLWNSATGAAIGGPMVHDGPVQSFAFSRNGARLEVRLLDGRTYIWASHPPGEAKLIWPQAQSVAVAPSANQVLVTDNAGVHVIDGAGRKLRTLAAGPGFGGAAWSPDGKWVAATFGDAAIVLVPAAGGRPLTVDRAAPGRKVALVDFTAGGHRLVVFHQAGPAMLIDVASGKPVGSLGDGNQILAFINHSDQVAGFWKNGHLTIYDADGHARPLATPNGLSIIGISGDGDAKLAAISGIGPVTSFWDMQSGKLVGEANDGESLGATRIAFRPGAGGWIARGDVNQTIAIWPWPANGIPIIKTAAAKRLLGHNGLITRLRVTPQGRLLSEGQDKRSILWDPLTGRALAHYENVATSRLSDDGKRLVILGTDGAVRLAQLPPSGQELLSQARARSTPLTSAERARYFLPTDPTVDRN